MRLTLVALALSATALMGCKNDLVGDWESNGEVVGCGNGGDFTIDDNDLKGDGKMTLSDGVSCFNCDFDIEAEDNGNDSYDITIDFNTCTINASSKVELDCDFDNDSLDCTAKSPPIPDTALKPYDSWDKKK